MSFKLGKVISSELTVLELADFWELECLKKKDSSASIMDVSKALGIADDIQEHVSEEEENKNENTQQEVVEEIQRRINSSGGNYPFKLNNLDYELSINPDIKEEWLWIYTYLLLATRNDMGENRIKATIDGTQLFEKLSKDVLLNYLGGNSIGIVFGTGEEGGFKAKLNKLVSDIQEGSLHHNFGNITYNPQDDKLDVVAWIPFKDTLPSKLICFAQCKTGTTWRDKINQLDVSDFLKKWFAYHPRINPIRAFIIADILETNNFYNKSGNNLFIDRCRLTAFLVINNDNDWFEDLKVWTDAVMKQFNLSFSAN